MADIEKHLEDLKKYTGSVDTDVVAKMAKTYALVMSKADTRNVAASDKTELARVKTNFLIKKLGLADGPDLDGAIAKVAEAMKADRTKSRLTFYYLLAEHFGKLDTFK